MRIFSLILILQLVHKIYGQQETTTVYSTTFSNTTTTITIDENSRTAIPTATVTISATLNASMTLGFNSTSTSLHFFSPSPTSFVFTHFPAFPIHTGSSSSIMSSARPSQSAPFPDDTIGKYGRLHISKASHIAPLFFYQIMITCLIFYFL